MNNTNNKGMWLHLLGYYKLWILAYLIVLVYMLSGIYEVVPRKINVFILTFGDVYLVVINTIIVVTVMYIVAPFVREIKLILVVVPKYAADVAQVQDFKIFYKGFKSSLFERYDFRPVYGEVKGYSDIVNIDMLINSVKSKCSIDVIEKYGDEVTERKKSVNKLSLYRTLVKMEYFSMRG